MFAELIFVADSVKMSDPCGATLIRTAAHMLIKAGCLRCPREYQRGYSAGFKAGVKEFEVAETDHGDR